MGSKLRGMLKDRELFLFSLGTMFLLLFAAFLLGTPQELAKGMITIVLSRDALVTDYFELAGFGAAFF